MNIKLNNAMNKYYGTNCNKRNYDEEMSMVSELIIGTYTLPKTTTKYQDKLITNAQSTLIELFNRGVCGIERRIVIKILHGRRKNT